MTDIWALTGTQEASKTKHFEVTGMPKRAQWDIPVTGLSRSHDASRWTLVIGLANWPLDSNWQYDPNIVHTIVSGGHWQPWENGTHGG